MNILINTEGSLPPALVEVGEIAFPAIFRHPFYALFHAKALVSFHVTLQYLKFVKEFRIRRWHDNVRTWKRPVLRHARVEPQPSAATNSKRLHQPYSARSCYTSRLAVRQPTKGAIICQSQTPNRTWKDSYIQMVCPAPLLPLIGSCSTC
jgi:hypothetical protein